MATLIKRKSGKTPGFEIRFFDPQKNRQTIYLGGRKYSEKMAMRLKEVVETLVYYRDNMITVPDKQTQAYLESVPQEIKQKLGTVGLIEIPQSRTLKELGDTFLKQK
jgi:hypothetical protein